MGSSCYDSLLPFSEIFQVKFVMVCVLFYTLVKLPRKSLNCSFEDGLCNWQNGYSTKSFFWRLKKGDTPSVNTGPSDDKTFRNGKGICYFKIYFKIHFLMHF